MIEKTLVAICKTMHEAYQEAMNIIDVYKPDCSEICVVVSSRTNIKTKAEEYFVGVVWTVADELISDTDISDIKAVATQYFFKWDSVSDTIIRIKAEPNADKIPNIRVLSVK